MNKKERFLQACRRLPVDRVPIWFMRQAGRYLPEYRAIRRQTSFLNLCRTPRLAAEVSMQPYRRFDLDAIILFSDILVLPLAMGAQVRFEDSGPRVTDPVRSQRDVTRLRPPNPSRDLAPALQTIDLIGEMSQGAAPVIGFAGGPYTLAVYLVEGRRSANLEWTRRLSAEQPEVMKDLLQRLGEALVPFAVAQIEAGAHAFLLMDTYTGFLEQSDYLEMVYPVHKAILTEIQRLTHVPTLLYVNGGNHLLDHLVESGAQVLGLDWRTDLAQARRRFANRIALQGNLDPAALFAPVADLVRLATDGLAAAGPAPGYIFNLGHGMLPGTPVEHVAALVEAVKVQGAVAGPGSSNGDPSK